jgi:hypothetical protein
MQGCEEMEQVYNQVTLSMILLKSVGELLLIAGTFYLFKIRLVFLPQWRRVAALGCVFGVLNAGLVIILGQIAYFATPLIMITFMGLYCFNKFPIYKIKHLFGLLTAFVFSSVTFFIGIAGTFFHLVVEGKI